MSFGNAIGKVGGVFKICRPVVFQLVSVSFIIHSRRENIGNNRRIHYQRNEIRNISIHHFICRTSNLPCCLGYNTVIFLWESMNLWYNSAFLQFKVAFVHVHKQCHGHFLIYRHLPLKKLFIVWNQSLQE